MPFPGSCSSTGICCNDFYLRLESPFSMVQLKACAVQTFLLLKGRNLCQANQPTRSKNSSCDRLHAVVICSVCCSNSPSSHDSDSGSKRKLLFRPVWGFLSPTIRFDLLGFSLVYLLFVEFVLLS